MLTNNDIMLPECIKLLLINFKLIFETTLVVVHQVRICPKLYKPLYIWTLIFWRVHPLMSKISKSIYSLNSRARADSLISRDTQQQNRSPSPPPTHTKKNQVLIQDFSVPSLCLFLFCPFLSKGGCSSPETHAPSSSLHQIRDCSIFIRMLGRCNCILGTYIVW